MNILQQLVQLSEVRILDGKLIALREKEKSLPAKANASKAKADELSSRLVNLESQHTAILLKRRQLDLDLQNERNNLRKWESRADQIRGDREYAALMSEIGALKRSISNIETQIIDDMQALEDLEKEIGQVKARSTVVSAQASEEYEAVKAQLEEVAQEIQTIDNAKTTILTTLPTMVGKRYKMLLERRAGMAVAIVNNEVCQGCMRTIPPDLYHRVARAEVVEQCPYCNRFLVTDSLSHIEHQTE